MLYLDTDNWAVEKLILSGYILFSTFWFAGNFLSRMSEQCISKFQASLSTYLQYFCLQLNTFMGFFYFVDTGKY